MSFFQSLTTTFRLATTKTHNDGVRRFYQNEYPRAEGKRLYAEFLKTGRVR